MAIAAGDIVTPHRVSAEYTRGFQGQPPEFGVCDEVDGGDRTILWGRGWHEAGIVEAALDEVVAPLSLALLGKVVELDINPTVALEPSGSYDATVVARYRRDLSASGTYTADLVLCKLVNADVYIETVATNARALDDR